MASLSPADPRPEPGDRDTFAELFDQHARHLFDYCCGLLGNRVRATSATQLTLIAGHSLAGRLQDPRRMRAWLLALGRWECLNGNRAWSGAGGSPQPAGAGGDLAEALAFLDAADDDVPAHGLTLDGADAVGDRWVRAALDALPRSDREILDLVYRHAVSLAELPAVLGIPARSAPGKLAAAREKLEKSTAAADSAAAAADDGQGAAGHWADAANPPQASTSTSPAYRLAAVPLATLPPSVWRRTARVVMDPKFRSYREAVSSHAEHLGPDGFPAQIEVGQPPSYRKLVMASALMAGLLLAPAAAGAAGYAAFAGSAAAAAPGHHHAGAPVGSPSGTSAGASLARSSGHSKRPGSNAPRKSSAGVLAPQPGTSAPGSRRKHSGSPSPTSRFSSPPSPKPSKSSSSPPPSSPPPSPSPDPTPSSPAASG